MVVCSNSRPLVVFATDVDGSGFVFFYGCYIALFCGGLVPQWIVYGLLHSLAICSDNKFSTYYSALEVLDIYCLVYLMLRNVVCDHKADMIGNFLN